MEGTDAAEHALLQPIMSAEQTLRLPDSFPVLEALKRSAADSSWNMALASTVSGLAMRALSSNTRHVQLFDDNGPAILTGARLPKPGAIFAEAPIWLEAWLPLVDLKGDVLAAVRGAILFENVADVWNSPLVSATFAFAGPSGFALVVPGRILLDLEAHADAERQSFADAMRSRYGLLTAAAASSDQLREMSEGVVSIDDRFRVRAAGVESRAIAGYLESCPTISNHDDAELRAALRSTASEEFSKIVTDSIDTGIRDIVAKLSNTLVSRGPNLALAGLWLAAGRGAVAKA